MTTTRFHAPFQTKGNVGKSSALATLCAWLSESNIRFRGFDLDPVHGRYAGTYPDFLALPLKPGLVGEAIARVFTPHDAFPVTVIDLPAQVADMVMTEMDRLEVLGILAKSGGRLTVHLFPDDSADAMESLEIANEFFFDKDVDFLITYNSHVNDTRKAAENKTINSLVERGARVIHIPPLMADTISAIQSYTDKEGRPLNFIEARERLPLMCRGDLDFYLTKMFAQYAGIADILVPPAIDPATYARPLREIREVMTRRRWNPDQAKA